MKKMMKIAAASLCLALSITTLSACSSTENTKPSTEDPKPTEAVTETTTEVTTTTTEATTTEESTTEPAVQAEIIPLWNSMTVEGAGLTINQLLSDTPPANWFTSEFISTIGRYWYWSDTGRKVNGNTQYQLVIPGEVNIVLSDPGTEGAERSVDIYFLAASDNSVATYFDAEGSTATTMFLPLYYNTGKKCLVGYWVNAGATTLVECYWNTYSDSYICLDVEDPSLYGF